LDYKSIGRNIRKCREAQGIKRERLAEMTDLSVSYMSAIERGEKLPKLDTFIRIANTLQVSSDALLVDVLAVGNTIVASEVSDKLARLPSSEQRRIMNVLNTMIADAKD
jgi:transcriptional regulator with XRE-family HTH domain